MTESARPGNPHDVTVCSDRRSMTKGRCTNTHKLLRTNLFLGLISLTFPSLFLKYFYHESQETNPWNGYEAAVTISFDCDSRKDVEALPQVLDLLSGHSFKAVFACVGRWIEAFPGIHERILREGHEIINHTYSHPCNEELNPHEKWNDLALGQQMTEIQRCHDVCQTLLGYTPNGFRVPHLSRFFEKGVYGAMEHLGYRYSSSTLAVREGSRGTPYVTSGNIVEFPLSPCPIHLFAACDTWHAMRSPSLAYRFVRLGENHYHLAFKRLLEIGFNNRCYINFYLDPQDLMAFKQPKLLFDVLAQYSDRLSVLRYEDLYKYVDLDRNSRRGNPPK